MGEILMMMHNLTAQLLKKHIKNQICKNLKLHIEGFCNSLQKHTHIIYIQ